MKFSIHYLVPYLLLLITVACTDSEPGNQAIRDAQTITKNVSTSRNIPPIGVPQIQIGTQIWMTRNLNVSRYRNGDVIPDVNDPSEWLALTTGAWCYYNGNPANGSLYGKLYNWYAVNDPRGLAPAGWHVPSYDEWVTLSSYLGETVAGKKMKTPTGWLPPNYGATNSNGFTGLPGGNRNIYGVYATPERQVGQFWSTTIAPPDEGIQFDDAWYCTLYNVGNDLYKITTGYRNGLSVRCVKD